MPLLERTSKWLPLSLTFRSVSLPHLSVSIPHGSFYADPKPCAFLLTITEACLVVHSIGCVRVSLQCQMPPQLAWGNCLPLPFDLMLPQCIGQN